MTNNKQIKIITIGEDDSWSVNLHKKFRFPILTINGNKKYKLTNSIDKKNGDDDLITTAKTMINNLNLNGVKSVVITHNYIIKNTSSETTSMKKTNGALLWIPYVGDTYF